MVLSILTALVLSGNFLPLTLAAESAAVTSENKTTKSLPRIGCRPRVESLTSNGRYTAGPGAALIIGNEMIRCPLPEGETTFIISFLKTSPLGPFTFVSENANVKGEMRIAVSKFRLPANSPKWIEVSGKTAFTHKRRFNLSMVGVEARYVKLSFHIKKRGRIAPLVRTAQGGAVPIENALATHRLEDQLNVNFLNL